MQYFLLTLFLLGAGAWLGLQVRWFLRFRIPPSLTTGVVLLGFFSLVPDAKEGGYFAHLKGLPSEFIALVFSCFFLRRDEPGQRSQHTTLQVLAQMSFVWVGVMGQVLIAVVTTLLIISPIWHFPLSFAALLETGFAGGHGTAVAIGSLLVQNGLPAGLELGLMSATIGLILGIAGGIWFARRSTPTAVLSKPNSVEVAQADLDLNSLIISLALIAAAYGIGIFLKGLTEHELMPRLDSQQSLRNFNLPLFAYTLVGGITVKLFCRLLGQERFIDNNAITLLGDFFLEILILAGIAIIDIRLIATGLIPLLLLSALGFGWNVLCHVKLRQRMLPMSYSNELGLINFGMLNGTSAIGLMLAKMVDPHFKTPAVRVFAESSALTQPFIAGGLLTLLTPYILMNFSAVFSVSLYSGLLVLWLLIGLTTAKRIRKQSVLLTQK